MIPAIDVIVSLDASHYDVQQATEVLDPFLDRPSLRCCRYRNAFNAACVRAGDNGPSERY